MLRLSVLAACAVALAACGDAQPAEPTLTSSTELAERMRDRFESSIGGVDGFAVLLGGYQMRYTVSGDTAARGATERLGVSIAPTDSASLDPLVQAMVGGYVPNVPLLASSLAGAPLQGPFERDGHRVYALDAGQAAGLDSTTTGGTTLRVYVDAATFDVREVYRAVRLDSLERPLTSRLLYDDFRTADGVTLPWRIRIVQEGLDQLEDPTGKIVEGGQLTLAREQLRSQPSSPERTQRLADVERRLRVLTEGVEEATRSVQRVTVQP